jgi:hypothetical protein
MLFSSKESYLLSDTVNRAISLIDENGKANYYKLNKLNSQANSVERRATLLSTPKGIKTDQKWESPTVKVKNIEFPYDNSTLRNSKSVKALQMLLPRCPKTPVKSNKYNIPNNTLKTLYTPKPTTPGAILNRLMTECSPKTKSLIKNRKCTGNSQQSDDYYKVTVDTENSYVDYVKKKVSTPKVLKQDYLFRK